MRRTSRLRQFLPAVVLVPFLLFVQCGGKEREADGTAVRMVLPGTEEVTLISLGGCLMAEHLVSYELWTAVKIWAESPARGGKVYSFANEGRPYPAYSIDNAPDQREYEPVVEINWRDAVVWMNAFTEWYNEHAAGPFPLEPVYSTDDAFTGPIRRADSSPGADAPFVNPNAAGFRLPMTASWEEALRLEIPAYDEEGNPKRRWLFPDIDGLNSEWCFDRGDADAEALARSWRGGGETLRAVPCSCAVSPPIRSMSPERTSGMLGFRFCIKPQ